MNQKNLTINFHQTQKKGESLGQQILRNNEKKFLFKKPDEVKKKGTIIALEGELGSGKTTFVQGFAKGLGIKEKILSPTFVILKKFVIPSLDLPSRRGGHNSQFVNFFHIDCYRIKKSKELLDLGFKGIIFNSQNIIAIEWADRIEKIIPKKAIWIKFKFVDKNIRKIVINKKINNKRLTADSKYKK